MNQFRRTFAQNVCFGLSPLTMHVEMFDLLICVFWPFEAAG